MIITQFANHPSGAIQEGTLFEMQGRNLEFLPRDLVALANASYLDTDAKQRYWPLHSISPDGTKAYFIQQETINYSQSQDMNFFATPTSPPRTFWEDYNYQPD